MGKIPKRHLRGQSALVRSQFREPKTAKAKYPCPLCGKEMYSKLELCVFPSGSLAADGLHGKVYAKFGCNGCGYEERTRGDTKDSETIGKLMKEADSYRGAKMFGHGSFKDGSVGVNRRRHVGIHYFEPVELPKRKG